MDLKNQRQKKKPLNQSLITVYQTVPGSRQAGTRNMWLVVHVSQRLRLLWMVFQATLFLVVKAQTILSAQIWMKCDLGLTLIHQSLIVGA